MIPLFTLILVALSVLCWVSFALAVMWHFARPAEPSWLMKTVASLATLFGLLQVMAMVSAPATSVMLWLAAFVLYGAALTLFSWAVRTTRVHRFALAFTPTSPTMVLSEGPYRWVRHPFYASYLLYWVAGACATQAWWMIGSVIVMGGLYWLATVQEEAEFLASGQAEAYRAYIATTGRFFPRLWGQHGHAQEGLSAPEGTLRRGPASR